MTIEQVCPYCGIKLDRWPKIKSRCRICGQVIYPRLQFRTNKILLLKKEELALNETDTEEYFFIKKWKSVLMGFGMTETEYEQLKQKTETSYESDVIWDGFNQLILEYSKKADFGQLQNIYYSMALFEYEEGRSPFQSLKLSNQMRLKRLQQKKNKE